MNNRGGYFLDQDISAFDAPFFSISPAEAVSMDPLQRLLLEVTYEAMESAGIALSTWRGSNTGCFVGNFFSDYDQIGKKDPETLSKYHIVGIGQAILSNRLSYYFGLEGPSITVDTACSSGLTALHLACQSLRTGESNAAIVGATNAILNPDTMVGMSNLHFLGADSTSYTFDARANGYARGEGMAALLLKPLQQAVADGDTIRAVIRGSAANSIGSHSGITLPKREAQANLVRTAYKMAGCEAAVTAYCEAHGTGTQAGDPVEVGAIGDTLGYLRSATDEKDMLFVGSVKTNIGHLEGASGLAAMIKVIKSLETGVIAPNLHFSKGNPSIDFQSARVHIPVTAIPWPVVGQRRASINSFGYGGSNAHVILDDAYHYMSERGITGNHITTVADSQELADIDIGSLSTAESDTASSSSVRETDTLASSVTDLHAAGKGTHPRLFITSAHESHLVQANAVLLGEFLRDQDVQNEEKLLDDLAFTMSHRRSRHTHEAVLIASSISELVQQCSQPVSSLVRGAEAPSVAYLFTGQGAQWWAMGRELMQYQVFFESIHQSSRAVDGLGSSWSLVEELLKSQRETRINEAEISQPLCTALQVALVDLLASWGIYPSAVVGHSSGEIAAAYATGALTLEDAITVAYLRGRLSARVKELGYQGSMLAAGCSEDEAMKELEEISSELGRAGIACVNSPRSVTLSGDVAAIDEMQKRLTQKNLFARKLQVETAYHSHHMESIAEEYLTAMSNVQVRPWDQRKSVTMYSSVLERPITPEDNLAGPYWVQNMVSCVKLSKALAKLCRSELASADNKSCILMELGPHSALASPVKQIFATDHKIEKGMIYLSAVIRERPAESRGAAVTTLAAVGTLLTKGYPVKVNAINFHDELMQSAVQVIPNLPTYSWNHSRKYWAESRLSKDYRFRHFPRTDLIGAPCADWNPLAPRWRNFIRLFEQPWVRGHVVQGAILYPAAGYICMAIEAAWQITQVNLKASTFSQPLSIKEFMLRDVEISRALVVPDDEEGVEVTFHMMPENKPSADSWREFHIFSCTSAGSWAENCRGFIKVELDSTTAIDAAKTAHKTHLSLARQNSKGSILRSRLYKGFDKAGLEYGPEFQGILNVTTGINTAFGTVKVANTAAGMPHKYESARMMHPTTMDNFLQMGMAAHVRGDVKNLTQPYVPTSIASIRFSSTASTQPGHKIECLAQSESSGLRDVVSNITALEQKGTSFVTLKGVKFTGVASTTDDSNQEINKHTAISVWKPDVDLITLQALNQQLGAARPHTRLEANDVVTLELIAYQYMVKAMGCITDEDVEAMKSHHQKFVRYMKRQQELVELGSHEQLIDGVMPSAQPSEPETSDSTRQMFFKIAEHIVPILRGEVEPLDLMMQDDLLFKYYAAALGTHATYPQVQEYVSLLAHKNPNLDYLEIGAGTGGCTEHVLEALAKASSGEVPSMKSFTFTDVSAGFLDKAAQRFDKYSEWITYRTLDIERDPELQVGFDSGQKFDVIVAANVLHATYDMEITMHNVRKLLRPGGKLILLDMTHSLLSVSLIFGTLPGWWNCGESWREYGPLLSESQWENVFSKTGFGKLQASSPDSPDPLREQTRLLIVSAVEAKVQEESQSAEAFQPSSIVVIESCASSKQDSLMVELLQSIRKLSLPVEVCTLESCSRKNLKGKIFISLAEANDCIMDDITEEQFKAVKCITSDSCGLMWITRGSLSLSNEVPKMSIFPGMARTLRAERHDIPIITVDLESGQVVSSNIIEGLVSIFNQTMGLQRGTQTIVDQEFSVKDGCFVIKRSHDNHDLNELLAARTMNMPLATRMQDPARIQTPLKIRVGAIGMLGSLEFVQDDTLLHDLPENQVEVCVEAISLERRDVLVCLGDVPDDSIASECAGTIIALGARVQRLSVGERVTVLARGSLATSVRVSQDCVHKVPKDMSLAAAASLPLACVAASYGLESLARVRTGESVLVTAASSVTGRIAVQLATLLGADTFAVTNSEEERAALVGDVKISRDHVFVVGTETLAADVLRRNKGSRISVILDLDSETGEAGAKVSSLVANFGKIIRLVHGAHTVPLKRNNVTATDLDISMMIKEAPKMASDCIDRILSLVRQSKIKVQPQPNPLPMSQLQTALETLRNGPPLDKMTVEFRSGDLVKVSHKMNRPLLFHVSVPSL